MRSFLPGVDDAGWDAPGSNSLSDRLLAGAAELRDSGPALRALGERARMRALAGLALAWRDPEDPFRREALQLLPAECGLSSAMVERGIDDAFSVVTEQALRYWWSTEAQGRPYQGRGEAPELSGHIWASNVFVAGLPPVMASLLVGSPALIKAPASMPSFACLLARSVREHAPELGRCLGAAGWSRKQVAVTTTFLDGADLLFAFGEDRSIEELRVQFQRPFYAFGARYSIAVLCSTVMGDDQQLDQLLDALADDQLAWDGQGCLSPRWIFVEGSPELAQMLAERAACRLPDRAELLPGTLLGDDDASHRASWLGQVGFSGWAREGRGWCCGAFDSSRLEPSPPPRSLCFVPLEDLDELALLLTPLGSRLQGMSFFGPEKRREQLVEVLEPLGLSRVCEPGGLQRPPLHWSHDGVRILEAFC